MPDVVTSLPTNPRNGDVVRYLADATNDVVWWLYYDEDSASTLYKWRPLDALPIMSEVDTQEGTASATYAALATAGPAITLPLAGDYYIIHGAAAAWSNSSGQAYWMSYDIGGTGAVDADGIFMQDGTAPTVGSRIRVNRKTGLPAVTLTCKYKAAGGSTATFRERFISAIPIRLG